MTDLSQRLRLPTLGVGRGGRRRAARRFLSCCSPRSSRRTPASSSSTTPTTRSARPAPRHRDPRPAALFALTLTGERAGPRLGAPLGVAGRRRRDTRRFLGAAGRTGPSRCRLPLCPARRRVPPAGGVPSLRRDRRAERLLAVQQGAVPAVPDVPALYSAVLFGGPGAGAARRWTSCSAWTCRAKPTAASGSLIAFVFKTWFFLGGVPEDLAALDARTTTRRACGSSRSTCSCRSWWCIS